MGFEDIYIYRCVIFEGDSQEVVGLFRPGSIILIKVSGLEKKKKNRNRLCPVAPRLEPGLYLFNGRKGNHQGIKESMAYRCSN